MADTPKTQDYLVLVQIGGAGDKEIYRPGSFIKLTDEKARVHLARGNVRPVNETQPPPEPKPAETIHEPPGETTATAEASATAESETSAGGKTGKGSKS